MRSLLISNPNSTSLEGTGLRTIVAPLVKATHLVSVHTAYAGHATEICRGITRDDYDVVIVVGGDGTVNEAINGLIGPDPMNRPRPEDLPALAVIPTGSANVFARALGFPNEPREAATIVARLLKTRSTRRLPMGRVEDRWFCVNTGFGIDAEVIDNMEKLRKRGFMATPGAYVLVALRAWRKMRRQRPTISFTAHTQDGVHTASRIPIAMVSNTNPWTYAGSLPVILNPGANIERGLSLYGLRDIDGPGGAAALLHALGVGRKRWDLLHVDLREIRVDDIDQLVLTSDNPLKWQVDGESAGSVTSLHVESFADVLDVVSPQINPML